VHVLDRKPKLVLISGGKEKGLIIGWEKHSFFQGIQAICKYTPKPIRTDQNIFKKICSKIIIKSFSTLTKINELVLLKRNSEMDRKLVGLLVARCIDILYNV